MKQHSQLTIAPSPSSDTTTTTTTTITAALPMSTTSMASGPWTEGHVSSSASSVTSCASSLDKCATAWRSVEPSLVGQHRGAAFAIGTPLASRHHEVFAVEAPLARRHHEAFAVEACLQRQRRKPSKPLTRAWSVFVSGAAWAVAHIPIPPPRILRREGAVLATEFAGTFLFLALALGATQLLLGNERGVEDGRLGTCWLDTGTVVMISLAWGGSAALSLWLLFSSATGGMFNPAITLGMVAEGTVPVLRALFVLVPAQLCAGIAAAFLVSKTTPHATHVATNISGYLDLKQAWTVEMLLTALIVSVAIFLVRDKKKTHATASSSTSTPMAVPCGIGLATFCAHLVGTNFTGAALNPARSLGTDVMGGFKFGCWVYYGGPFAGTAVALAVYLAVGYLEGADDAIDQAEWTGKSSW